MANSLSGLRDGALHGVADLDSSMARRDTLPYDPAPPFPSLFWPPQKGSINLHELDDMWKFTLFWTLILYGLFHVGAVGVAVLMQVGKRRSNWTYLWVVPLSYAFIAGAEAIVAGSVVGLVLVPPSRPVGLSVRANARDSVGASYLAAGFPMSTWIPFVWGWVNVLILIVSSFRIQGGL
ncbi:hypothetical protein BT67DRAFT_437656 [Trichocladium antarcticum]|uniref:Integral membrane protein n=1 Tax=Trichocladium antarcticum TaxID=1450529 RepID=A0AAN6USY6_9PEZI|nr:hypothetical protein BT67DRAFT_437656 [Trichocladium antarcticum]